MSKSGQHQNTEILSRVVDELGDLATELVFVGGTTTALLVSDLSVATVRITDDTDAIVEARSVAEYYAFGRRLKKVGFAEDATGPVCRCIPEYDRTVSYQGPG